MRLRLKICLLCTKCVSFHVVIHAKLRLTVLVSTICFVSCFMACVPTQVRHDQFPQHLTFAYQRPRTFDPLFRFEHTSFCSAIFDRTSQPILSVDNTSRPLVSEAANLFCPWSCQKSRRAPRPATMGFDGQELATRWSIVAKLRKYEFPLDGGSYKANRNGSGDVEGLRSNAHALIPTLHMAQSGFSSPASMRHAWQAVHKTHEIFAQISDAQLSVTSNTVNECRRLMLLCDQTLHPLNCVHTLTLLQVLSQSRERHRPCI